MGVKGSWIRAAQISLDDYDDNWEQTFRKGKYAPDPHEEGDAQTRFDATAHALDMHPELGDSDGDD